MKLVVALDGVYALNAYLTLPKTTAGFLQTLSL
jgi:hypothetical protein